MIEAVGTSGLRRLLDYVRAYRADHDTPPPVRREQTLRSDLHLPPQSARSGTLTGFIDYCNYLPRALPTLVRRLRRVRRFPLELAGKRTNL